jgi:hypothetical protein
VAAVALAYVQSLSLAHSNSRRQWALECLESKSGDSPRTP